MSEKTASIRLKKVALTEIKPHPRNPRRHPEPGSKQWEVLAASLGHDYFDPLVLNERNGMLVSGHFRCKVLAHLGFTHADVSVVDYDEPTHLARMIAANELLGAWESDLLEQLAKDISASGLAASLAGWDEKQMAQHLDGPIVTDDTESALVLVSKSDELQREWQVKVGDLFQVGNHRLLCGDCTLEASWRLLLGDRKADLFWSDPPYNIDYDSTGRCDHLRIATLGMSVANADTLACLVERGHVGKLTLLVSLYFAQVDKTTVFRAVTSRLHGIARPAVTRNHAKVICLPTSRGDAYVVEGSANLRSSDNVEQMLITNDGETHAFHASWIDELAA